MKVRANSDDILRQTIRPMIMNCIRASLTGMDDGIPETIYRWLLSLVEKLYSEYWALALEQHTIRTTARIATQNIPVTDRDLDESDTVTLYRFKGSRIYATADIMWRTMATAPHWDSESTNQKHPHRPDLIERDRHYTERDKLKQAVARKLASMKEGSKCAKNV